MIDDPIIDYWETKVTVDLVYKSVGAFVYLELKDGTGLGYTNDFARLTPEQALELAGRLTKAAGEAPEGSVA
jgi:hypothetical protein